VQRITRSDSFTAPATSVMQAVAESRFHPHPFTTSLLASWPADLGCQLPRRVAWAMEEPIRPKPMMAIFFSLSIYGRHELLDQGHRQPVLFLGAHRHAQNSRRP